MDKDPKPLKASGGTPVELQRALRALGRSDRDAARLARVAERLSATVAASGAPAASGLGSLTGTKIALIGLAVSLGAAGLLGYALIADEPAPAVQTPAAPAAVEMPAAAASAETPADLAAPAAPVPVREPPRVPRPSDRSLAQPRHGRVRTIEASRVAAAAEPDRPSAAEPSSANTAEPSSPNTPEPTEANTAEPVQAPSQPLAASVKPSAQSPVPPGRSSETALLHEARKVAAQEPETALRLLNEHARRFPSGVLVPERELLAIEVLRRLDRDAEAERRLRRFEARYPRSIHLRRLEREPSAAGDL